MRSLIDLGEIFKGIKNSSDAETGAYIKMLILHMSSDKPLPTNIKKLRKLSGINSRNRYGVSPFSLEDILAQKFKKTDKGYIPLSIFKGVDNLWITCGYSVDNLWTEPKTCHNCSSKLVITDTYAINNNINNINNIIVINKPGDLAGKLSQSEVMYIDSAIGNTIENNVFIDKPRRQILEEVIFYVLSTIGKRTFKHSVNICMKLISQGRWETPWGFIEYQENSFPDIVSQ